MGGAGEEEPDTTAGPRPKLAPVARSGRTEERRALIPVLWGGGTLLQGPRLETGRHYRLGDSAVWRRGIGRGRGSQTLVLSLDLDWVACLLPAADPFPPYRC